MSASKMTVITGLKYEVVETIGPFGRVRVSSFSLDGYSKPSMGGDIAPESIRYREFYISGRRICTPNGKEVFLGNAPGVEEFLGLQFDLVENLKREKEEALDELSKAEKEKSGVLFKLSKMQQRVMELENALQRRNKGQEKREEAIRNNGFFTRLKYLFTGELL